MDTPVTPAGSEAAVDEPSAPVAPVSPAPKPQRVRNRKKARSAPVAPADVHIDTMRRNGLAYDGPAGQVFFPPRVGKPVPGEAMDGPTAAYHVPDRATLLWLLDRGFRLVDPPAPEQE